MSLTSCYRYILELPVNTLTLILRAALSEDESAGIAITQHWENVAVAPGMTATVDARPTDLDTNPPSMGLDATDLSARIVQLRMRVEVKVNEQADLDAIVYTITFDLPGVFEKDSSSPPKLLMKFPSVTEPDLNLVVTGGELTLTPELIEPRIHQIYDDDPTLGHTLVTGQDWIKTDGTHTTVQVTTDIYDDDPGSGFRGAITVEVPNATSIVVVMPGHIKIQGISTTYIDSDMTLRVTVGVEIDHALGKIRVRLSNVASGDIAVLNLTGNPAYVLEASTGLQLKVAEKFQAMTDLEETIPSDSDIHDLIAGRLIDMAPDIVIPIFTPAAPTGDEIDLTTFVPTTVNQQVLALQLVPLADGTPCDTPNVFAQADGFAIAIARPEVDRIMQPLLDNNEGDRTAEGYDITVNNLTGTLSDAGEHSQGEGHIWIEGSVTVHVDCWPDPDVDFWGPVTLTPSVNVDNKIVFTAHAGGFDADDPCCGDVDPTDIQALIEGEQSTPVALPNNFTDVGRLTLGVTDDEIFAAGIVVHGTLAVTTETQMQAQAIQKTLYWYNDDAGGR